MTRIGPANVTRDSEGRVELELHGRRIVFSNKREWDEFLFGPDSHRLPYNSLSWVTCPVPQDGTLADGRRRETLVRTDWG